MSRINHRAFLAAAVLSRPRYRPRAVHFDGVNDFLLRGGDLTGMADGKQGTFSCWVNVQLADGVAGRILTNSGARLQVLRTVNNALRVAGALSDNTIILDIVSDITVTAASGWVHLLASWDLAAAAAHLYLDDVSRLAVTTLTDNTIDYTRPDWAVGATVSAANLWGGYLADLWFSPTYLDLSVAANRRKFIAADRRPVDLGHDGARPLGLAPIVFMAGPPAAWHVNRGTGGGFTLNGALDEAPSRPGG